MSTKKRESKLGIVVNRARQKDAETPRFPIQAPELFPGVVPPKSKPLIAMDGPSGPAYSYAMTGWGFNPEVAGFPGYPYLVLLSTRPEYRAFASALATAVTREWIVLNSSETAGDTTKEKITKLEQAITEMKLKDVIALAAEHDSYFGRAQIAIIIDNQNLELPLILSAKTIKKGAKVRVKAVEAMWTTPLAYNAIDPSAPDFYKPSAWFMMGKRIHASRLMTIVTRPLPDMLKPAFNFGGMSMSQLAEPYVKNWLRTRQSVSDLINNFSISILATKMDQVLQGDDDGCDLFKRVELFTLTRSNKGMMVIDKETEEIVQVNTPLSSLPELQAQAQEQMCAVSHIPAVILLGVAPTGFGNVAEGEIRSFYDWVKAIQEAYWREPIETILKILQISLFGEIDPDITMAFQPLYQMTAKELSEIRAQDATAAVGYIQNGVIDPTEERERLARDPESGYQGIDTGMIPGAPEAPNDEIDEVD